MVASRGVYHWVFYTFFQHQCHCSIGDMIATQSIQIYCDIYIGV